MIKEQTDITDIILEFLAEDIDRIIKQPRDTIVGYIFTCDYCNTKYCRSRAEVITDILTKRKYASCPCCGREACRI